VVFSVIGDAALRSRRLLAVDIAPRVNWRVHMVRRAGQADKGSDRADSDPQLPNLTL